MTRFHTDWVIRILIKNDRGVQVEIADLGNGKHMIVATDIEDPVSDGVFRQGGYGPFVLEDLEETQLNKCIELLIVDLVKRRGQCQQTVRPAENHVSGNGRASAASREAARRLILRLQDIRVGKPPRPLCLLQALEEYTHQVVAPEKLERAYAYDVLEEEIAKTIDDAIRRRG